ncbi:hypothetical protein ACFO5R_20975 [Halosolutus amylolyticus]|uniref:Uncharacterized protein n=1 Tax=Halosolutus amylolyticus TaxID=2932267 RepID=A0ABD5PVI3_9EURY|nr:hypothetical protein [Halosolutus amylolyticus]
MRLEFLDHRLEPGWAEDDGVTYTWSYDGATTEITDSLTEAEDWSEIDTGDVTSTNVDGDGTVWGETHVAISPEARIDRLRRLLEFYPIVEMNVYD